MATLKQIAVSKTDFNALMQAMCPPDKPDAKSVEYDFSKCPQEMRGEMICAMAKMDGFIVGISGTDITMYTNGDDAATGDKWFEVIMAHHHAVMWHLICQLDTPKILH